MTEPTTTDQTIRQFVTFSVGGESFAADVLSIREIVRTPEITRLPCSDEEIVGMVNVRGRILPVADGSKYLGVDASSSGSRIVIVERDDASFGLLVDSVEGVIELTDDMLQPVPPSWPGSARALRGIASLEDRLLAVIDLDEITTTSSGV